MQRFDRHHVAATLLASAGVAAAFGGCGGNDPPKPVAAAAPPPARATGSTRPPSRSDLERQLGNAFDAGLYRLAVMGQPPDSATDLGQDLPKGAVEDVSCSTTRCTVRWHSVTGGTHTTRYAVRFHGNGCFSAGARPSLPPVKDATIATYSEHPLNALVSTRKGC